MIQHVWERVSQVPEIAKVLIATDDERIGEAARGFGADVVMTSAEHPSGTDRVWEAAQPFPAYDWVLNVQGDEPFINADHLRAAIAGIARFPEADVLTLVTPLTTVADWQEPNLVKAVVSGEGQALYFSRAAVPYHRDAPEVPKHVYRHIGIYLYRRAALERFTQLLPSPLEQIEKLEQLRALENGMRIFAVEVSEAPVGVDTPADLVRILDSVG